MTHPRYIVRSKIGATSFNYYQSNKTISDLIPCTRSEVIFLLQQAAYEKDYENDLIMVFKLKEG